MGTKHTIWEQKTLETLSKEVGFVKTTHRFKEGLDQKVRLFNKDQRQLILDYVIDRPANKTIIEMLEPLGIDPVVYHNWKRKTSCIDKKVKTVEQPIEQPKKIEFKILSSHSVSGLNQQIKEHIFDGFKPVGGHQVVKKHEQLRLSGLQHKDTTIENEYSQSMIKE